MGYSSEQFLNLNAEEFLKQGVSQILGEINISVSYCSMSASEFKK